MLFLKNPSPFKILLLLHFLYHILQILHKHLQLNYKGPLEAGFLNLPSKIFLERPKVKISSKNRPLKKSKFLKIFRGDRGRKSKIRLLKALCNLIVSVRANFEECAAKTVGGVGFLMKAYFSRP